MEVAPGGREQRGTNVVAGSNVRQSRTGMDLRSSETGRQDRSKVQACQGLERIQPVRGKETARGDFDRAIEAAQR